MGGKTSKAVARTVVSPLKDFNIENRVHKAITDHKTNPKVAPYHPSTAEHIQQTVEGNPEIKEELEKKDTLTIDRMNKLHIETSGNNPLLKRRELPQLRNYYDSYQMMERPETSPQGKLTLLHIAEILDEYKKNPKMDTVKKIAKDYNMDLLSTGLLVKYFAKLDLSDEIVSDEKGKKLKDSFIRLQKSETSVGNVAETPVNNPKS